MNAFLVQVAELRFVNLPRAVKEKARSCGRSRAWTGRQAHPRPPELLRVRGGTRVGYLTIGVLFRSD